MIVNPLKRYRNIKTGAVYEIMCSNAMHTETDEQMVVYRRNDIDGVRVWIRPLELFKQKFEEVI